MSKRSHAAGDGGSSKRLKGTNRDFAWIGNSQRRQMLDLLEKNVDDIEQRLKKVCGRMDAREKALGTSLKLAPRRLPDDVDGEGFAVLSSIFQWWLDRKRRKERVGGGTASIRSGQHLEDGFVGVGYPVGMWQDVERERKIRARERKQRQIVEDAEERQRAEVLFVNAIIEEMSQAELEIPEYAWILDFLQILS